jgi:hypothetical protein
MTATARLALALAASGLALAACDKKPSATPPAAPASAALPANLILAAAPDHAQSIVEAKAAAKPGDTVTIHGRLGGSEDPFINHRAIFTLVDTALPACSDTPGDACTSPWDYCCEDATDLARKTATVQIVGPDGQPLKMDVKGAAGLEPLAEVFVVGTVRPRDNQDVLVVDATGVFARPWRAPADPTN